MKHITEAFRDKLIAKCNGGYLDIDMKVLTADGALSDFIRPGCWIVAENYYGYTIKFVNDDLSVSNVDWDA